MHQRRGQRELFLAREFDSPGMRALLEDPDSSQPKPRDLLKDGNSSTVWLVDNGGRPMVIKRYNSKNLRHGIRLSLRRSRAVVSWQNAHLLRFLGIPTPRPIAALLVHNKRLQPVAYFVSEAVRGTDARSWFQDMVVTREERLAMADRIVQLLAKLRRHHIIHQDMKATNILISKGQPMLIDLDAMTQHRASRSFVNAWQRDMRRFLRNWQRDAELLAMMKAKLSQYNLL